MRKFIFVVGGVMSSVGKGVTAASIGAILQSKGYRITNIKCDMYINIDAGTIRPTEHGEVFVGEDGIEADQDLGNYERFTGNDMTSVNYVTTGQVYQEVIRRERNLEFGGEDVEVVPDIPDEIIRRLLLAAEANDAEITIVEFGGTVGEYQVLLFLEAARMMKLRNPQDVAFVLVSYLPVPAHIGEMKTKPTQHASRSLNEAGIQADYIIARGPKELDKPRRDRLAIFCNVKEGNAISAPDCASIYQVPVLLEKEMFGTKLLETLGLTAREQDLSKWTTFAQKIVSLQDEFNIAIVGKYFGTGTFTLADSYISVIEAVKHACWAHDRVPHLTWINSEDFESDTASVSRLDAFDGIIVPGGFGERGIEGIILAIQFAREKRKPYLGLCYGMQLACVEFARNVLALKDANTTEVNPHTPHPIIFANPCQAKNIVEKKYGATMRLGAYPCVLADDSLARQAYGKKEITERHRHRYEFNNDYRQRMHDAGLHISGTNPESNLVEIVELNDHPFFVGVQFHPEFRSRPMNPHPLFLQFIHSCKKEID